MGIVMGAMVLMMAHGAFSGQSSLTGMAALAFFGAHVALTGVAVVATAFGLTRFPRFAKFASKLHKPNLRHVLAMLASAIVTAAIIHLIHGGP